MITRTCAELTKPSRHRAPHADARDEDKRSSSVQTRGERAAKPIEEKESFRWLLSMRQAREEASRHPQTQIVYVADSEADIYEVIAEGMEQPRSADWIAADSRRCPGLRSN